MSNRTQQSIDDGSMTAIWAFVDNGHPALFREGRDIRTSEQQCSGHIHTLGSTVTARGTVV
jgi:hypothetical protein